MTSACVETSRAGSAGYGYEKRGGVQAGAHRWAYVDHHGLTLSDIKGQLVRHKCDNRKCINAEHLELGSAADNSNDMVTRGRSCKHEAQRSAKLTLQVATTIRQRHSAGVSQRKLATEYGVHHSVVGDIIHFRLWKPL